jgi:dihydrofolate synthase/folylpolyglutamate synthase
MPKLDVQEYLESLSLFGMHFGLDRIKMLLSGLGDPQLAFPAVHVTGTNGKGSVCKMLACILQEAGYRTGLYMSPHLERFNERISVDGTCISDNDLVESVSKVRPVVDEMAKEGKGRQCTYFEATTAVAFDHFRKVGVDMAVIEVGLGGRLDATNIIDPLLSIITNISLEHTDVLGKTVEKIASEKAGIIKKGRPVVTAARESVAVDVFRKAAAKNKSPFYIMQREVRRRPKSRSLAGQGFGLYTDREAYRELFSPMVGRFQLENAALAVLSAEILESSGLTISPEHIKKGIARAKLPGRMEFASLRPNILLDSAHNPAAARAASVELEDLKKIAGWDKVHLLFGVLADKDLTGVLEPLLAQSDSLTYTKPSTDRALDIGRASERVEKLTEATGKNDVTFMREPDRALHSVMKRASAKDLILVTGSMYLVGEIRGELRKRHLVRD